MEIFVAGCHGGDSSSHRSSAFVIDKKIALDAGAIASGLTLEEQAALEVVWVSHPHFDQVRDLATTLAHRAACGAASLTVTGSRTTLDALRAHVFNGIVCRDFTKLRTAGGPVLRLQPLRSAALQWGKYTLHACAKTASGQAQGCIVTSHKSAVAYSAASGPMDLFWQMTKTTKKIALAIVAVRLPDARSREARRNLQYTPASLAADLRLHRVSDALDLLVFHTQPAFSATIAKECTRLAGLSLTMAKLGDRYRL